MNKDQRRMDCPHYLKQLDVLSPGSEVHEDPGVREAVAHLSECESCAREFQARGEFDRQVAVRMRDVLVPVEARERLLEQLRQSDMMVTPASTGTGFRRSVPWKTLVALAACVLFAVWILNRQTVSTMTMVEVQADVVEQFGAVTYGQYNALDEFDGSFDATIDDGRWRRFTNSTPRGVDLNRDGTQDAAVYWIDTQAPGVLLVLSPGLVVDPPQNASPGGVACQYSPVRVAWLPDGSSKVHLCVLNSNDGDRDLRRLLNDLFNSLTA